MIFCYFLCIFRHLKVCNRVKWWADAMLAACVLRRIQAWGWGGSIFYIYSLYHSRWHISTWIGVVKHEKSFAPIFIDIRLLFIDFLLFCKSIIATAPGHATIPDRTSYWPQATSICRRFRTNQQRSRGQEGPPFARQCVELYYIVYIFHILCLRDMDFWQKLLSSMVRVEWCI